MCARRDEVAGAQLELTRPRRGAGGRRIRSAAADAAGRQRRFGVLADAEQQAEVREGDELGREMLVAFAWDEIRMGLKFESPCKATVIKTNKIRQQV